jgi:hypothetical protein
MNVMARASSNLLCCLGLASQYSLIVYSRNLATTNEQEEDFMWAVVVIYRVSH